MEQDRRICLPNVRRQGLTCSSINLEMSHLRDAFFRELFSAPLPRVSI